MKSDPGFQMVAAIMSTADTFLRESQRLFRPYGATGAQYNVLNILMRHPEGLSQRELGDLLVVDRSNVTGLLDRLEKMEFVRRADHPGDRRIYRVMVTPAGRACWEIIHPLYLEAVAKVTHGLTEKQVSETHRILLQLEQQTARLWDESGPSTGNESQPRGKGRRPAGQKALKISRRPSA